MLRTVAGAFSMMLAAIGFTVSLYGTAAAATAASGSDGGILYTKHCAVCHGPAAESTVKGATTSQITKAISNVTAMKALAFLRVNQIQAIAKLQLQDAPNPATGRITLQPNPAQAKNTIAGN